MSIEKEINERKEYLETIISSKEHSTENEIEGYLKIVRHKNGWQYYYKEKENDERYHYICKGNRRVCQVKCVSSFLHLFPQPSAV